MKKINFSFLFIITIWACKKENIEEPTPVLTDITNITTTRALISNEGNFQWNNAELTLFDIQSGLVTENVYNTNNNKTFGDVCQTIYKHENKIYAVLNNSASIKILDAANFQEISQITGLNSPRYILPINTEKAYVSDIYDQHISVLNLNNNSISKKIACAGWTEQMLSYNGITYVTNRKTKYVYCIDEQTDIITDSILVAYGSNSIQIDEHQKIWVLCSGDQSLSEAAGLYQIEPDSNIAHLKINLPNTELAWRLMINSAKNKLYFLQKHVYEVDITTPNAQEVISGNNKNYYGLSIHPENNFIYVSDAVDYVQKGSIEIYNTTFSLSGTFKAGIIPGDFVFF